MKPATTEIATRTEGAVVPQQDAILAVISRAASDPSVDVEKMERLMLMHERVLARNAEAAFNESMRAAQGELRQVATDANNSQTRSRYATYAALDAAARPVYTAHGFAISFDTGDAPRDDLVRVMAYVSHSAGHTRQYKADMPADGKGAKGGDVMTKTHAFGAGTSYGMRYLLKMIFNIAVGEYDNDGNDPKRPGPPEELLAAAREAALQGTGHYRAYWSMLTAEQRKALAPQHDSLKQAAEAADKESGK